MDQQVDDNSVGVDVMMDEEEEEHELGPVKRRRMADGSMSCANAEQKSSHSCTDPTLPTQPTQPIMQSTQPTLPIMQPTLPITQSQSQTSNHNHSQSHTMQSSKDTSMLITSKPPIKPSSLAFPNINNSFFISREQIQTLPWFPKLQQRLQMFWGRLNLDQESRDKAMEVLLDFFSRQPALPTKGSAEVEQSVIINLNYLGIYYFLN